MVAATGAGVAAVDHELVGAEAGQPRILVKAAGDRYRVGPTRRRMDIDLDDSRVGGHLDDIHTMVEWRTITFYMNRNFQVSSGRLDSGKQLQIIFEPLDR